MSVGQEHVDRCEELGHGQETERRGWEPPSLQYRWVPGATEDANLRVAKG